MVLGGNNDNHNDKCDGNNDNSNNSNYYVTVMLLGDSHILIHLISTPTVVLQQRG